MNPIDVLRSVDFDWAMRLSAIWDESPWDVAGFREPLRKDFATRLDKMFGQANNASPLGMPIIGPGGSGKTHLLGVFRREAARRNAAFVLVDMTDVRDFWETVLQGYLDSLQQRYDGTAHQHQCLLRNVIQHLGPNKPVADILSLLASRPSANLPGDIHKVLTALHKVYPREVVKFQNVVRSLICLNSDDFTTSSLGMTWLQGQEVESAEKKAFGLTVAREEPRKIIEALSWIMSLSGPTILAFDQLDPIVSELKPRQDGGSRGDEQIAAGRIFLQIGTGLGTIRDLTRRTLTIVSCLEETWEELRKSVLHTYLDRFGPVARLNAVEAGAVAEEIARARLDIGFAKHDFRPAYSTWPFKPEAFAKLAASTPRQVLQKCDSHIRRCIQEGVVTEIDSFGDARLAEAAGHQPELDRRFEALKAAADPKSILDKKKEDERFAPLLRSALSCLIREQELASNVDALVDADFAGGATTRPLHARLRLIFLDEKSREEHFCVRSIQHSNSRAYQSRLKAAMTQSGIDKALNFRHLTIVRSSPLPGGAETEKLSRKFEDAGGQFARPTDDDIRALSALHSMRQGAGPEFEAWLKLRQPSSKIELIRQIVRNSAIFKGTRISEPEEAGKPPGTPATTHEPEKVGHCHEALEANPPVLVSKEPFPLGLKFQAGKVGEPLTIPVIGLEKHTVVFAGAGSGKTVLLKRLVEEAALRGIPSIIIDGANDLAALDEEWTTRPESWSEGDEAKARRYHDGTEVIVWTPGRESGNPMALEHLPDLAAVANAPDELEAAVAMVIDSLKPIVAASASVASKNKLGVLSSAVKHFAKHGGGRLDELIALLLDLPPEAGLGLSQESKMAREMGESLKVARELSPLLKSTGTPLDPAVLFGDDRDSGRTRISVISLVGLQGTEAQRQFLNQLAMTLFSWIKKNPAPEGRPLRGLLVTDEARDFVPSVRSSACKESLTRLVAQARKYHLGMVFATQNPKDIETRIVGNCSTHYYGKVNAPAAIEAIKDQIREKGGHGDDVTRLRSGQFHVHNADIGISAPVRVQVPMCLTHHPANPLDEGQVLRKAAAARQRTAANQQIN